MQFGESMRIEELPEGKLSRRDQGRIRAALREEDARRRVAEARALLEELDPAPPAEGAGTQDG